jgi:hypothetical protein
MENGAPQHEALPPIPLNADGTPQYSKSEWKRICKEQKKAAEKQAKAAAAPAAVAKETSAEATEEELDATYVTSG